MRPPLSEKFCQQAEELKQENVKKYNILYSEALAENRKNQQEQSDIDINSDENVERRLQMRVTNHLSELFRQILIDCAKANLL